MSVSIDTHTVEGRCIDVCGNTSDLASTFVVIEEASGAAYTGMYKTIAENFAGGDCGFTCGEGPPMPGCPELDMLLVQNDEIIATMGGPGLIKGTICRDGSFAVNATVTIDGGGPSTMEITVTGDFSADEVDGSATIVVEGTTSCDYNFDFSGPVTSNATVTVNGFTESKFEGVNVYAMVFVSGVTEEDVPPAALGGGELTGGSVIIDLKPTLADGPNTLGVIVDVDGNIEESFSEGDGGPVSEGDWATGDIILTISGGSGSVTLNKNDDFGEMN